MANTETVKELVEVKDGKMIEWFDRSEMVYLTDGLCVDQLIKVSVNGFCLCVLY